jgi:L-threonylcarbamoyladenylate synthase
MGAIVDIEMAVQTLRRGDLLAFPTETVYGLGADALNVGALERLYRLKGRPSKHPVIVHVASAAQAQAWASEWSEYADALAAAFWPGPLTLLVPKSGMVLEAITGGFPGVGLRVPRHPVAQRLLQAFDGGVAAPSANRYGQLSPTQVGHVRQAFGADCPALLEGGPSQVGLESTIVDLTEAVPVIRRLGHITPDQIAQVLGFMVTTGGNHPAPGTVKHHYAPHTPLHLLPQADLPHCLERLDDKSRVVILAVDAPPVVLGANVFWLTMPTEAAYYNRRLYAALHEADALQAEAIWVVIPPCVVDNALWHGAIDRLQRAAAATVECDLSAVVPL